MGMDLVALSPSDPQFHEFRASWIGWGVLSDLLVELGCDIAELSNSNDGEIVSEGTARELGRAIEENLDQIVEVRYRDPSFTVGFRSELRVVGTKTPVLLSRHEISRVLVTEMYHSMATAPHHDVTGTVDEVPVVIPVMELPETLNWLLRTAWFFRNSGGFAQF
jgi:hypothetical protein